MRIFFNPKVLLPAFAFILMMIPFHSAQSEERPYIPVGSARTKKTTIAFPEIRVQDSTSGAVQRILKETITHDLTFIDMFKLMDSAAFVEEPPKAGAVLTSLTTFNFADWTKIGADILIKTSLSVQPDKVLVFETHLYNTVLGKEILSKKYFSAPTDIKKLAHNFANDVVTTLTGLPGIFLTKIAMSCDRTNKKEIYIMNYDGTEVKQVTNHRSIAFGPAWSPDSSRIAYSLFTRHKNNQKNIDLYEYNFIGQSVRLLSSRQGINSGPAYSPDGKNLAVTMSFNGNPEIYLLDSSTLATSKLTHSFGFDVDPSWSPDGQTLTFVSSRAGLPMVFSMKVIGGAPQRLTFAGKYNATPHWSPQNNKIAFAGWLDGHFDIFIMNPDGTNIERLTKNQGNNEDPHFSPDGNFIAFSSNRAGKKNVYVMNIDGSFVRRLTYNLGNCVSPKWSNPPPVARSQTP